MSHATLSTASDRCSASLTQSLHSVLSALARDLMVQEVIVGQFVKIGARILTVDGVDLTSNETQRVGSFARCSEPWPSSRRTSSSSSYGQLESANAAAATASRA